MSDNKYDDLEKLFRSRLKNESPAENQWNVPPMGMLDSALDQLEEDKETKRRFPIWWFAGVLLFVVLVSFYIVTNNKIEKIESELSQLKTSDIEKAKQDEKNEIEVDKIQISLDEENLIPVKEVFHDLKKKSAIELVKTNKLQTEAISSKINDTRNEVKSITSKSGISEGETIVSLLPTSSLMFDGADGKNISQSSVKNEEINSSFLDSKKSEILTFSKISSLALSSIIQEKSLEELDTRWLDEIEIGSNKYRFSYYLFGGLNLSSIRMTNVESSTFSLINYDKNYLGFQIGIGTKFELSQRWALRATSSLNQMKNESQFSETLIYNEDQEVVDVNGNLFYESNLYIESPMGGYATSARFALDNGQLVQDDLMKNKTDVSEVFRIWNISLGLEYTAFSHSKFDFFLAAGLGANYLWRLDQEMKTELSFEDDMLMNKSFESSTLEHTKKFYLSAFANVGIRYQVNDSFGVELSSGFNRGLSSMRYGNDKNQPNTYLNSVPLNLSMNYKF